MDFASSTRAATNRTRWKGIVTQSSVMSQNLPRSWELKEKKVGKVKSKLDNSS